ncbi:MlaD family protein [Nocardia sp. NPDC057663]|uniref:MlaD family protein n=1 Tax=Nocardia sp. NPDC057663 TaxID=3346201 RepID=UPI003672BFAC
MPAYGLPGSEVGPLKARLLGVCALALALIVAGVWRVLPEEESAEEIGVVLIVGHVGDGIGPGTDVRLDGVRVGSVSGIDFAAQGRRQIELSLARSELFGLTSALSIDYVPGNLFGISALELHPDAGGAILADGSTVDLTAGQADRVRDATLASLLSYTGDLTEEVLTPQLTQLLHTFSRDLVAFTPLLQAIGTTARSYTETAQLPPSVLFDRYGRALAGVPPMLTGGLTVLHASYNNGYLAEQEHLDKFAYMWPSIQNELLPAVTALFGTAQPYFGGLLPIVTMVLDRVSRSVSDPAGSAAQSTELMDRLDRAFRDGPNGPVLDARVELDLVPGLAAPLSEMVGQLPAGGGPR